MASHDPTRRAGSTTGHTGRQVVWIGAAILLAGIGSLAGLLLRVLLRWSPGKPLPVLDAAGRPLEGSISEKIHVCINGVEQGMFLKGTNAANPILLLLHGGPGMPDYFLTQQYPTGLEEDFTVCWWEQRGAGLSYRPDITPETMTVEQFIADTLAVTDYLRQRFGQPRIYLLGLSGGSFFGIQAVACAPERYHAYIGVAQMAYQLRSENLAYAYMLQQFTAIGDRRMARALAAAPVTMTVPLPRGYEAIRDTAMHRLGIGTTHAMKSVVTGIFLPVWRCPEYTLGEKINIWRGRAFTRRLLWNEVLSTDLRQRVLDVGVPVYFCHGAYDYTVSNALAHDYLDLLHAPLKGFYTFAQSAHSPLFEEPEQMRRILREDVLAGTNRLADEPQARETIAPPGVRGGTPDEGAYALAHEPA